MKMGRESNFRAGFQPLMANLPGGRRAFTLIEIMIVVGIIGIVMAAGVPTLYRMLKKDGFRQTVNDVVEVCAAARARAIMEGVETEVWFHPKDGTCEVAGGGPE